MKNSGVSKIEGKGDVHVVTKYGLQVDAQRCSTHFRFEIEFVIYRCTR